MAIYTELTKKDAVKIVEEFALGDLLSFSGIKNGSVNTHYLLETKRGRFFAKIDEVKSELEVKQELDLLFHLKKQGFPCLQPLKTKLGRYYIEFRGKCLTVSRHLDGVELRSSLSQRPTWEFWDTRWPTYISLEEATKRESTTDSDSAESWRFTARYVDNSHHISETSFESWMMSSRT